MKMYSEGHGGGEGMMQTRRCTTTLGVAHPPRIMRCWYQDDCDHGENHLFYDPRTGARVLAEVSRLPMGSRGFAVVIKEKGGQL